MKKQRENSEKLINLVNSKLNIDINKDTCEKSVYGRAYVAKKMALLAYSTKYIAKCIGLSHSSINRLIKLEGYSRESYIKYKEIIQSN